VDRPATLELALQGRVPAGTSQLLVSSGDEAWPVTMTGDEVQTHKIGSLKISQPGYFRIEIQGKERTGNVFADIRELVVMSETADLKIDYVRNNDGNMFYLESSATKVRVGKAISFIPGKPTRPIAF
jgi:hypothetical protein